MRSLKLEPRYFIFKFIFGLNMNYQDEAEDREEESGEPDDEGVPLVPVQDLQAEAVNKEIFQVGFYYRGNV